MWKISVTKLELGKGFLSTLGESREYQVFTAAFLELTRPKHQPAIGTQCYHHDCKPKAGEV